MVEIIKFIAVGVVGGILGGMGMGGGTLLIPLLTMFLSVAQKSAQAINLLSFIPMAVVALIMHFKNKLIKKDGVLYVIIPACLFAILGSVLCLFTEGSILKKIFGGFLIALSFVQFFSEAIVKKLSKNKKNME